MFFKKFPWWMPVLILGVLLIAINQTLWPAFIAVAGWIARLFSLLVPFFIGGAIAYLLLPPCRIFEKLYSKSKLKFFAKRARGFSIISVYLIVIALIFAFFRVVIPVIYQSIEDFISQWPTIYAQFIQFISQFDFIPLEEFTQIFSADNIMNFMNLENILGFTQGILNFSMAVLSMFIGIAVSIYILLDRDSLYSLIHRIGHLYITPKILNPLEKYTRKINEFLYKYIYCQLLDGFIVGIVSFIGLSIIGVPYAPVSALLLGIFNFIPYFGSIIATAIAILLALFAAGPQTALVAGIFLLIMQQIDANVIQPRLAGSYLKIRPFWVILGILIGGGFFGIWGMFLAPPVVAVIKIIVGDILVRKERSVVKYKRKDGESTDE